MIDYKKLKDIRIGVEKKIVDLDEKTDAINEFDFIALDDASLNRSQKLSLNNLGKQVGEANKIIESDTILIEEEIDSALGTVQKLKTAPVTSYRNKTIDWNVSIGVDLTLSEDDLKYNNISIIMNNLSSIEPSGTGYLTIFTNPTNIDVNGVNITIFHRNSSFQRAQKLLIRADNSGATRESVMLEALLFPIKSDILSQLAIGAYDKTVRFTLGAGKILYNPYAIIMGQSTSSSSSVVGGRMPWGDSNVSSATYKFVVAFWFDSNVSFYSGLKDHSLRFGSAGFMNWTTSAGGQINNTFRYTDTAFSGSVVLIPSSSSNMTYQVHYTSAVGPSDQSKYYTRLKTLSSDFQANKTYGSNQISCSSYGLPYIVLVNGGGY